MKAPDLTGQRFGKLVVIKREENGNGGKARWLCRCDCGNITVVSSSNLRCGKVKSCGCSLAKDLTGKKFGRWTVIKRAPKNLNLKSGSALWECACACGTIRTVCSDSLLRGHSKSCGCANIQDLTGRRFGRLTVLKKIPCEKILKNGKKKSFSKYLCKCDCGNIKEISAYCLLSGETTSCGCYHKEKLSEFASSHKQSNTRLYRVWSSMIQRCNNTKNNCYKNYGQRGISVCEEWNRFENFMEWAILHGYSDDLTIERIDVNGNYCPENCKWITKSEQSMNTRRTVFVEIMGQKKALKQWTNLMNWKYGKYENRHRKGHTIFSDEEIKLIEEKLRSDLCGLQTNL